MSSPGNPWLALAGAVAELAVDVDERFGHRVRLFLAELERWSRVGRLTAYRGEASRVRHLVIESLLLLHVAPEPTEPLLDIGSGAGVPGLIVKLARPAWDVALVEANRRRVNFLRHVVRELGLDGVSVYQARAEDLRADPGLCGKFQTVTIRAVAPPHVALELARPLVRSDGHVVLPLGTGAWRGGGTVREVGVERVAGMLPLRRRFLIIAAKDVPTAVPRGTPGARGTHFGGRQSERWCGQDHDRR